MLLFAPGTPPGARQGPAQDPPREAHAAAGAPSALPMRRGGRAAPAAIRLSTREGAVDVAGIAPDAFMAATNFQATSRGTHQFIVPCPAGTGLAAARGLLEKSGARVLGFIPSRSFLVEATLGQMSQISGKAGFGNAIAPEAADRVSPHFAGTPGAAGDGRVLEGNVSPLRPDDLDAIASAAEALGGRILAMGGKAGNRLVVSGSMSVFESLARREDVRWIEGRMRRVLLNDKAVEPEAMDVRRAWNALGLSGAGQTVAICDSGIDTGDPENIHVDFSGRIAGYSIIDGSNDARDTDGHGTHTAGSLAGSGAAGDGLYRGVAYGAAIFAQKGITGSTWGMEAIFDDGQDAAPHYVHSNSWGYDTYADGTSCAGDYVSDCRDIDLYAWNHPEFLPVFAAGNSYNSSASNSLAGVSTLTPPATAKNVLSVGATYNLHKDAPHVAPSLASCAKIAPFSSQGPCDDGRIKPDVVAPGLSVISCRSSAKVAGYQWGTKGDAYAYNAGTSMACPLAAGTAALVRQYLMERAGFGETPPTAALVKAVLCGGATDITAEGGTNIAGHPAPDTIQGWGRVDLAASLEPEDGSGAIFMDRVPFGDLSSWAFTVEVTNSATPLSAQLCWIDYPAQESAGSAIVNDLDLVAVSPSGRRIYGNSGKFGDELEDGEEPWDTLNNSEGIRVEEPENGTWTICVNGEIVPWGDDEGGAAALYVRGAFDPGAAGAPVLMFPVAETCYLDDLSHRISVSLTNDWAAGVNYVALPETGPFGLSATYGGTALRLAYMTTMPLGGGKAEFVLADDGTLSSPVPVTVGGASSLNYIYMAEDSMTPGGGVPKWWFYRYIHGTASRQGGVQTYEGILAADYDGDGFSNAGEYVADTNPVDSGSRLAFIGIGRDKLRWTGGRESTQFVMRASSPAGPWTAIATNAPPTPVTNEFAIDAVGAPAGFFKIDAAR